MSYGGRLNTGLLLGGLALIAFSLVVWFVGDLAAIGAWRPFETPADRGALIAAAAAAWIGWELWRARRARLQNQQLLAVLAGSGVDSDPAKSADSATRAAREIALLRARFEEAAAILRKTRFKGPDGESRYVHELPW